MIHQLKRGTHPGPHPQHKHLPRPRCASTHTPLFPLSSCTRISHPPVRVPPPRVGCWAGLPTYLTLPHSDSAHHHQTSPRLGRRWAAHRLAQRGRPPPWRCWPCWRRWGAWARAARPFCSTTSRCGGWGLDRPPPPDHDDPRGPDSVLVWPRTRQCVLPAAPGVGSGDTAWQCLADCSTPPSAWRTLGISLEGGGPGCSSRRVGGERVRQLLSLLYSGKERRPPPLQSEEGQGPAGGGLLP